MDHTRRGFMKLGLATLPLTGILHGADLPAFASTSPGLQNESSEAATSLEAASEAVNDLATLASPQFQADYIFSGSVLSGWHTLGQADWRAENGEIIGKAHPGSNGGWLVLDKSFQDVLFYGSFSVPAGSKTGILVRAEKTPGGGLEGIFLSLDPQDLNSYHLTVGPEGQEVSRSPLRAIPQGSGRYALPAPASQQVEPPPPNSQTTFPTGEWNTINVQMDANIFHPILNGYFTGIQAGATDNDGLCKGFGPIALYAGGTGEIRLRDVRYKDFGRFVTPLEKVSSDYRMQQLDGFYYTWGSSVADVDRNGILDIVAGPLYYVGPDYTVSREIMIAETFAPGHASRDLARVFYTDDFTGDGWPDLLRTSLGFPLTLYRNPRGELRRWDKYVVGPRVISEIAVLGDLNDDGKKEILFTVEADPRQPTTTLVYARPDPGNPTGEWIIQPISEPGNWGPHGIGVGDITGDGTLDVLTAQGWFEHPPKGSPQQLWKFHPVAFTPDPPSIWNWDSGGATMVVYDVNGDGLNDIVTSLHAHNFGLAWYEQKRDSKGNISFVRHMIMDDLLTKNAGGVTFSELHGLTCADMDGDGIPDVVTGKRYLAEANPHDPEAWGAPVLYVYHTVRDKSAPGGARFVPELIYNRSGVGSTIAAADLNHNGVMDIVTSTVFGTFVFWGKPYSERARSWKRSS
jgi:hypothetical protein